MSTEAPRRFYKTVSVAPDNGVMLDERRLRTPRGAAFSAPNAKLAKAIAEEWASQGELIIPATMPLTQLAFATTDGTMRARGERTMFVASYGETDLCCHRAEAPAELVAHQAAIWDPIVVWGAQTLGVQLPVVSGIIHGNVPADALAALRAKADALDDFRLTALAQATGLSGSALIGFAMLAGRLDAKAAFEAAALDDLWSQQNWGRDDEAQARLQRQRTEFESLARFIAAL